MDGASIAAIEPYQRRRERESAQHVESVWQEPEAPIAAEPEPVGVPNLAPEPVFASEYQHAEQGAPIVVPELAVSQADFGFETPAAAAPAPTLANVQPIARIVDPSVAEDEGEPLFAPNHFEDRRQKGGWLSLFGRPRPESGGRQVSMGARPTGGAQPAFDPVEDHEAEEREDLEIPSFLRRLAN
jgi:cell division protein FtsZ